MYINQCKIVQDSLIQLSLSLQYMNYKFEVLLFQIFQTFNGEVLRGDSVQHKLRKEGYILEIMLAINLIFIL